MATLTSFAVRSDTSYIDNVTGTALLTNNGGTGKNWDIAKILITNTDTVNNQTLYLYVVPNATTPTVGSDSYVLYKAYTIAPSNGNGGTEDLREMAGFVLEDTFRIFAIAGAASKLKYYVAYFKES